MFWSLFFIFLLYFTAPALAVLVKYDVYTLLVGTPFANLPQWVASWQQGRSNAAVDRRRQRDGIVQLAEIAIGGDIVVLATPEIGGLPYVISGLVAAGGLAAALSTADGLLLTIANALSHDLYYKMIDPNAPTSRRVTISKILLLVVAIARGLWSRRRSPPTSCSWCLRRSRSRRRRSSRRWCWHLLEARQQVGRHPRDDRGARHHVLLHGDHAAVDARRVRRDPADRRHTWWGIQPISAGLWGVPLGFAVIIIVSLLTPAPDKETQDLVEHVRYPNLAATLSTVGTLTFLETRQEGPAISSAGLFSLRYARRMGSRIASSTR